MDSKNLAWLIRRHGIEMTHLSQGSHIGAILSVADIIAVLYASVASVDSENPKMATRDRIILSKGHAGAAIYAALAERGFFPVPELKTHYQNGSKLSGHVSHKGVPGVEFSTGSLGHGLSVASGMAMAAKLDGKPQTVFCVLGDGECDEGAVWECALTSNHFKLDNLVAIIDHNKMQSLDYCENTISLEPLADKWKAFGWNVVSVDGHNHSELFDSLQYGKNNRNGRPTIVIANTIKGKGISFMENNILWHYRFPHDGKEYDYSLKELEAVKPENCVDPYAQQEVWK